MFDSILINAEIAFGIMGVILFISVLVNVVIRVSNKLVDFFNN